MTTTYYDQRRATRSRRPIPPPSVWKAGRPRRRLVALGIAVLLLFGAMVARVGMLQTVDAPSFQQYGERQRVATVKLQADRGVIFDRNGVALAVSVPATTIWADPRLFQEPANAASAAVALGSVLGFDQKQIAALQQRLSQRNSEFVYVARQVDDPTAKKVEDLGIKGVATYREPKRVLPNGDLGRSIIGLTDTDGNGTAGLEKQYEQLLAGTPGELVRERDAQGRTIPTGRKTLVEPTPGNDLVLTLDRTLQYQTEEFLKQQVTATQARGGVVVVMDTKTGDILTMASVRVDPTTKQAMVSSANLALVDTYEPGSVAKMMTASAGLQERVISPGQRIFVPFQKQFYDVVFQDAESHPDTMYDIEDIIAHSSNIGTMTIAKALGPDRMEQYFRAFGIGSKTPLDFPGEADGVLKPAAKQRGTEKLTISFGQGVNVTAVQLVAAMNTIANGGTYVAPRLVRSTIDAKGVESAEPASPTRQVLTPETDAVMHTVLRAVVCRGTGRRAAVPGYAVAGKTGTSYKVQANGTYQDDQGKRHYIGSFAGFVPADSPRFTVVVSIDEPQTEHYGGLVAAPVFVQVAQEVLKTYQVPPSPDGGACPAVDKGGE